MPGLDLTMIDNERVAERMASRAAEHGEIAAQRIREVLKRHVDSGVVSIGIAKQVAKDEAAHAEAQFPTESNHGLQNDLHNRVAKGVTALVFDFSKRGFDTAVSHNANISIEEVGKVEADRGTERAVFKVELPDGIFMVGEGYEAGSQAPHKIHFFAESQYDEALKEFDPVGSPIDTYDFGVLRIIGGGGELWQNPDYNLDGSHRPPQPVDFPPGE